ncbi:MAG: choice-of-anchor I family protein [Stagnimonas sp.]|nr:choice-of-anchor I family protein [Stagnimonas sp.]
MKIKSVSASLALATVFCVTACSNGDNNTATAPIVTIPTPPPAPTTPKTIRLIEKSRFKTNKFDLGAAEIPAFDAASKRVFVVNGADKTVDVISLADITAPTKVGTLNLSTLGAAANSVSVKNGIVAVAIEASPKTNPGKLGLYRASDLTLLGSAEVGALPDMLTFTADGKTVLVANEGEPSSYGQSDSIDPEGSVSVVDVSNPAAPVVRTAGFAGFNSQAAALRTRGVRLFGTNASVAQDVEPEYIAISPDGTTAMVSLQEANALAKLNIATATITDILPLGLKNHSMAGRGLDPSDRDTSVNAGINIGNWPVMGMYMPDTIASYSAAGKAFYVTANEGDARDYTGLAEEVRVGAASYVLDPTVFPNATDLKAAANLGRLTVSNKTGDTDGDGDFDQIHVFGGRSFSIFDEVGALVFDSGDEFERRLAALSSTYKFNPGSTNNTQDDRSDNKGPEPEALSVFTLGTKTFAAIGLERQGGIFTYDITTPTAPVFMDYVSNRKFVAASLQSDVETGGATDGDLAPEGIVFVTAADSPSSKPLLIVANETSGTTTVYEIELQF